VGKRGESVITIPGYKSLEYLKRLRLVARKAAKRRFRPFCPRLGVRSEAFLQFIRLFLQKLFGKSE
jgi:hypothetical protein